MVKNKLHGNRYPWKSWFRQGEVVLRKGKEFDIMPHGMAQNIRQAAARLGYKVSIYIDTNGDIDLKAKEKSVGR